MYHLIENNTKRAFPETVTSLTVMRLPKRKLGETVGFDNGGEIALVLDADNRTLVRYEYRERVFSAEAYLNG